MSLYLLWDICVRIDDVFQGTIAESDFAAGLSQVLKGNVPDDCNIPVVFFANTGLHSLRWNVSQRLNGTTEQVASIFRLGTNYGGGKTHALVALSHQRGMPACPVA